MGGAPWEEVLDAPPQAGGAEGGGIWVLASADSQGSRSVREGLEVGKVGWLVGLGVADVEEKEDEEGEPLDGRDEEEERSRLIFK